MSDIRLYGTWPVPSLRIVGNQLQKVIASAVVIIFVVLSATARASCGTVRLRRQTFAQYRNHHW